MIGWGPVSYTHLFPSFLQQLEMESNGKSVTIGGEALDCATSPIVWGELGNNGQHAFFQLLHQGGRVVPCDFIAAVRSDFPLPKHQEALLSNCFAQSAALAFGKNEGEVRTDLEKESLSPQEVANLLPHRVFAGNQPSSTLLLTSLNPGTLGALIALYEHKAVSYTHLDVYKRQVHWTGILISVTSRQARCMSWATTSCYAR